MVSNDHYRLTGFGAGRVHHDIALGPRKPAQDVNTIVAFIHGWKVQWYAKVPGDGGARMKAAFGSMVPESKLVPLSAVTVCATAPVLVHVTSVPTFTLSSAGA